MFSTKLLQAFKNLMKLLYIYYKSDYKSASVEPKQKKWQKIKELLEKLLLKALMQLKGFLGGVEKSTVLRINKEAKK